jgi:hypothetical protein
MLPVHVMAPVHVIALAHVMVLVHVMAPVHVMVPVHVSGLNSSGPTSPECSAKRSVVRPELPVSCAESVVEPVEHLQAYKHKSGARYSIAQIMGECSADFFFLLDFLDLSWKMLQRCWPSGSDFHRSDTVKGMVEGWSMIEG